MQSDNTYIRRPSLLTSQEFALIPAAVSQLRQLYSPADVERMVQQQPVLIVEDVHALLAELQRYCLGMTSRAPRRPLWFR